jgi:predicted Zn-dependent peptidase
LRQTIERLETLSSGFRLAWDDTPSVGTTALAFFVGVGSRDELPSEWGLAHLLEHLLFKGAGPWAAPEIARRMDDLGGEVNAFTTRDYTCYYAKVLDHQAVEAYELLTTMIKAPWLDPQEFKRERRVIREEIRESRDDPDDLADTLYLEALFDGGDLTHDTLGTPGSLAQLDPDAVRSFFERWYHPGNVVLAVSGGGREGVLARARDEWAQGGGLGSLPSRPTPRYRIRHRIRRQPLEQVHLIIGGPAPVLGDPESYTAWVLATLLGGQNSSRLWQSMREVKALVYSVQTQYTAERDYGELATYLSVGPDRLEMALAEYRNQMTRLATEPVSADELTRAVRVIETAALLAQETPDGRVMRMGRWGLWGTTPPTPSLVHTGLAAVTPERIQTWARSFFDAPYQAVAAVGPVPKGWRRIPL